MQRNSKAVWSWHWQSISRTVKHPQSDSSPFPCLSNPRGLSSAMAHASSRQEPLWTLSERPNIDQMLTRMQELSCSQPPLAPSPSGKEWVVLTWTLSQDRVCEKGCVSWLCLTSSPKGTHTKGFMSSSSAATLYNSHSFVLSPFLSRGAFTGCKPQDWVLEHPVSTNGQFQQQTWWHLANLQKTGESLNLSLSVASGSCISNGKDCSFCVTLGQRGALAQPCSHLWPSGPALQNHEERGQVIQVNARAWDIFPFLNHSDCLCLSIYCLYLSINSYALLQAN